MLTNEQHVERLESLAVELDKAMAFLDPPTAGETYWQELDATSLRAGAAALREIAAALAQLEAPTIYRIDNEGRDVTALDGLHDDLDTFTTKAPDAR